jgi:signal transduction histidine kinase
MIVFQRRVFWKVYLTLLAMGVFWWLMSESSHERWGAFRIRLTDQIVPARDDPPGAIEKALRRLGDDVGADISLYDRNGALLAWRGPPIALAPGEGEEARLGLRRFMRIDLPDGRAVLARLRPPPLDPKRRILTMVLIVAGGAALAAFPVTARLTRRLEGLRSGVERWGAGSLAIRADETGDDEVAVVARAFNAAAGRVEALVTAQKALLANASHELRSPLARLRMAIELWLDRPAPDIHAEIVRNLREIDQLVEEILLASRLDHGGPNLERAASVDLLGLAAEEGARVEACVTGMPAGVEPVEIEGDATLLRRMIRNLLENAAKHGRPPIEIAVTRNCDGARLVVSDHGEGIAPSERERVFEPFYRPAGRGESAGGWGLGLSLVRQIANRHGGAVSCEAAPGGGSRFVVEFAAEKNKAMGEAEFRRA